MYFDLSEYFLLSVTSGSHSINRKVVRKDKKKSREVATMLCRIILKLFCKENKFGEHAIEASK